MSLWLYATPDGVGSARELDRLCGGVGVNHHTLGDSRDQSDTEAAPCPF